MNRTPCRHGITPDSLCAICKNDNVSASSSNDGLCVGGTKSELAIKRDEWFESVQGITALSNDILHFEDYSNLLKNRLEAAFLAGAKAQKEICDT